ncbi:uncharacterized protein CC84DRAFT_1158787 [Paraphaeosphaeria sporulosa]|uniref:Heterokaryon incompatibility domain-containing protein n=1 Tax=Paraphaeosphaeria sporulosa TaxID=1460663 RepID=A0A177CWB8_9PLEO|nr:uncharacterized protein CC84DRAFT_1158787 [Paraphaeosphaeria sporulosa]OAG11192.1 hypothetical protein CC84DRAFT_1158787 [Paraphaeosphaeria sporulosa]
MANQPTMPSSRDILLPTELTDFFFAEGDESEHFPAIFLYTIWPILLVLIYPTLFIVFLIEGIVELVFVCWLKTRGLLDLHPLSTEGTPLLASEDRAEVASRRNTVATRYPAVDVAAIDLSELKHGAQISSLPVRLVEMPMEDPSHIAVVSWRWDFSQPNTLSSGLSLNVAQAIKYAKAHGIHFLFIDIISLDQNLSPEELIPEVARFSTLYETIPVIAAYDDTRLDFEYIMIRPWIFSEIKKMMRNPHKIVYVGHLRQGTYICKSVLHWWLGRVPRHRMADTRFLNQLRKAWFADYVPPVLALLNGHNNMTDIHDFKFIIPPLAEAFTAAEKLPPNDYLLTIALLLSNSQWGGIREYDVEGAFLGLPYTKYQVRSFVSNKERAMTSADNYTVKHIEHTEMHEIRLGDEKIATFSYRHDHWKDTLVPRYTVTVDLHIRRRLLGMLELDTDDARYAISDDDMVGYFLGSTLSESQNIEVVEQ